MNEMRRGEERSGWDWEKMGKKRKGEQNRGLGEENERMEEEGGIELKRRRRRWEERGMEEERTEEEKEYSIR
jgi:hypothetical protein